MKNDLVYIRNQLLNGQCNQIVIDKLQTILKTFSKKNDLFEPIYRQVINNALLDIYESKFENAGYQINFIHNMPFTQHEVDNWNESHFYEFELPVYFENTDDAERIKQMIILIASLASNFSKK